MITMVLSDSFSLITPDLREHDDEAAPCSFYRAGHTIIQVSAKEPP